WKTRKMTTQLDARTRNQIPSLAAVRHDSGLLTDHDLYLFNEGSHFRLHDKLGAHPLVLDGQPGTHFAVWAPDAERVSVIGDFNGWNKDQHLLQPVGQSGIWQGFIPGITTGAAYKYHIASRYMGYRADKADPFAFWCETPPRTASIVCDLEYSWGDRDWLESRKGHNAQTSPLAIYEVHLGSWMRVPEEGNRPLGYRELAPKLAGHVKKLGFTHVELMP